MVTYEENRTWRPGFQGLFTYTTALSRDGLCATTKVGAGAPVLATVTGDTGAAKILLDNTSEAQSQGLSGGDVLGWRLDKIHRMKWNALVGGVDAVTTIGMGLASAYNATLDSIATNAWFRIEGSVSTSTVYCESDDGTTDRDDKTTGLSLSSTFKAFEIDLTQWPYVNFIMDGVHVCTSTVFTMADLTAGTQVQPYFFVRKASGTGVPALTISELSIDYTVALGA